MRVGPWDIRSSGMNVGPVFSSKPANQVRKVSLDGKFQINVNLEGKCCSELSIHNLN